jgi:hypothetical protein
MIYISKFRDIFLERRYNLLTLLLFAFLIGLFQTCITSHLG